jgi:hypothetical protein
MRGDLPLWTGDRVRVPIDPECREVVSLSRLGLPAGVREQRTDKLDPMVGPARRQQACIDVRRRA